MKYNLGDKVIHQKGNIPRKGEIISDPGMKAMYRPDSPTDLAFYGENNYFEWLDKAEPYLKHANNTSEKSRKAHNRKQ